MQHKKNILCHRQVLDHTERTGHIQNLLAIQPLETLRYLMTHYPSQGISEQESLKVVLAGTRPRRGFVVMDVAKKN